MKLELKAIESSTGEINLQRGSKITRTEKTGYDGGFHISRANPVGKVKLAGSNVAANERVANARSSLQSFTCK